jgi:hypothetical protein
MLNRREPFNRAVSIVAYYAFWGARLRFTEPNDRSQAVAVDLWHLADLFALFHLIILVYADRIYPVGGCGSRTPELSKTYPQVHWNFEGLIVIDTDVHQLRIVGPTVRDCSVSWHLPDVVFFQCTGKRIKVTAGVYSQDSYLASSGASFVECRIDRELRHVDQDPSTGCKVFRTLTAVACLFFLVRWRSRSSCRHSSRRFKDAAPASWHQLWCNSQRWSHHIQGGG